MPRTATRSPATKGIATLLCFLLSPLPALTAQQAPGSGQKAGEVGALRPEATRNEQVLKVKDEVQWNDFLKTLQTGRLRAQLLDGSLLSMGSNSQMRVLQHDAASQQTELELSFGRLRNRVVKLTKPGAKYEVKTPHAVIGVIGTDFYIFVDALRTVVIVYTGKVVVRPLLPGAVQPVTTQPGIEVGAGQMLEIRAPTLPPAPPTAPGEPPTAPGAPTAPPTAPPAPGEPPTPPTAPGAPTAPAPTAPPTAPPAAPGAAPPMPAAVGAPTLLPLPAPQPTPPGVQEDSIAQTTVEEPVERPPWSPKKKILVLGGITAAILTPIIIVVTRDDQGCSICTSGP